MEVEFAITTLDHHFIGYHEKVGESTTCFHGQHVTRLVRQIWPGE